MWVVGEGGFDACALGGYGAYSLHPGVGVVVRAGKRVADEACSIHQCEGPRRYDRVVQDQVLEPHKHSPLDPVRVQHELAEGGRVVEPG